VNFDDFDVIYIIDAFANNGTPAYAVNLISRQAESDQQGLQPQHAPHATQLVP
jgi:hypothetical protein